MSLFAEYIPEGHRASCELEVVQPQLLHTSVKLCVRHSSLRDTTQIALHVGGKYRYTDAAEGLGHHLQSHCFPSAGSPGNKSMSIRHPRKQHQLHLTRLCNQQRFSHILSLPTTQILYSRRGSAKLYRLVRYLLQSL